MKVSDIDRLLDVIRSHREPHQCWRDVVSLCRDIQTSGLWDALPVPDIERDTAAAQNWLSDQLSALPDATGIYLGLDTLNMDDGSGTNIEIGGTSKCDPSRDELDWLNERLNYGTKHLIYGLYELHAVYSLPQWKASFSVADYVFFLGYSGIVLGQAFTILPTQRLLLPVWGFHDGDLFILGRKMADRFEFICQ